MGHRKRYKCIASAYIKDLRPNQHKRNQTMPQRTIQIRVNELKTVEEFIDFSLLIAFIIGLGSERIYISKVVHPPASNISLFKTREARKLERMYALQSKTLEKTYDKEITKLEAVISDHIQRIKPYVETELSNRFKRILQKVITNKTAMETIFSKDIIMFKKLINELLETKPPQKIKYWTDVDDSMIDHFAKLKIEIKESILKSLNEYMISVLLPI